MSDFTSLNLSPKILSALEKKGYTKPTPIQEQSIPHILEHKDLLGIAQTGTGKTAAFALPILQNLSSSAVEVKPNHVRCLILTPTRELASQIVDNIELYGADMSLKHAVIFGGVGENPQIKNLQKGLDIVVATPGRLLDLMSQGHVRFSQLEIFVLDEADRMLDMGFINDVKKIITKLPEKRQTLFFSATMPEVISYLAKSILTNPVKVEITPPATTVERIDQKIYLVERSNKPALLRHVLEQDQTHSILVFLRTKHGADRLADFLLKNHIKTETIHGDRSQSARELALANFREGKARVLIATDIAARGIDIPGITHVINYDIPSDPESYVHRIGRTARAGKDGIAISFCDPTETLSLKAVEKTIAYRIPVDSSHPFHGASGVSGVRKLASSKKTETSNSNETNKMNTQQPRAIQSGRKISSAKEPQETRNPAHTQNREPRASEPRKPRPDRTERSSDDVKKEHTRPDHKRTPHHKPKQGLIGGLIEKVKAIFGFKKEEKKKPFNKNRNYRGNSKPRTRRPEQS